ncbi:MAG: acyl-CoA thioesterase [Alcanivoracaceae bacterium]|nr:acyl-CoA thioesterase [Alcanivoracaceae bacterium]
MIETYRGVVYPTQLDHMGHMNVMWYTSKFDEATWHLLASIGITSSYIRDHNKGMVAVEQTTKYMAEAQAGDLLVIKSKIIEVKDKSIKFMHIMYNTETDIELATTELLGIHLDRKIRKACSLPAFINRTN